MTEALLTVIGVGAIVLFAAGAAAGVVQSILYRPRRWMGISDKSGHIFLTFLVTMIGMVAFTIYALSNTP